MYDYECFTSFCVCVCVWRGVGWGGVILFRLLLGSVSRTDPSVTNMNYECFAK